MRFSGDQGLRLRGWASLAGCQHEAEQEREKPCQPGAEQAEIVACGGEDEIAGIALGAEQEVAAEVVAALHVANDGLDGVAPAPFAANGGRDAALLASEDDAGPVGIMYPSGGGRLPGSG
jgi:hypothetical protein